MTFRFVKAFKLFGKYLSFWFSGFVTTIRGISDDLSLIVGFNENSFNSTSSKES